MVTVGQGKVCAKNHPDRLSRLATIHQRYRQTNGRTDGRISCSIGLDLTVGQLEWCGYLMVKNFEDMFIRFDMTYKLITLKHDPGT